MLILSFESSCDETSVAVTEKNGDKGFTVKSNITASQIDIHARFGGVVPEIASRAHCEAISSLTERALKEAGVSLKDINAIAVTSHPGLIGALIVGVNFAKALAYANGIPLVSVDHIKGHICANYLTPSPPEPPFLAFVASGGHTSLILVKDYNEYITVGTTRDDAMGEAFDKTARVLGIPYPGGAALDALAYKGKPEIRFPSGDLKDGTLDFSFSGMKTAVLNHVNSEKQAGREPDREKIAASFVKTAVESAVAKLDEAIEKYGQKTLVLAGGVSANSHLRGAVAELCRKKGVALFMPELIYCGDNAAMIGAAGYYEYTAGRLASASLNASASD